MRSIYEQAPMAEYYWILGHLSLLLSRLKHSIPEKASWERMQAFIFKSPPQLWNYSTTRTPYSTGFPQHQAHFMAILDLARNLEVDYQQGLIDISLTNTDLCYYE